MPRHLKVLEPQNDGYTLMCEECGDECGVIFVVNNLCACKACASLVKNEATPLGALGRLRLLKQKVI